MKEVIVNTQAELEVAVKQKNVEIIIKDTTEWLSVSDNATIKYVSDNATIQSVSGNATIQYVYGNATIQSVSDNATIQSVYDNATIQSVSDNATIQYVYGNATIQSVYGNATIKIFSADVTIETCLMFAVIIMIGCVCKIKKRAASTTIIKNKLAKHDKTSFRTIYQDQLIDKTTIKLFKSVRKDNHRDFHTNSIEYSGEVVCPDFNPDKSIQCGQGLHLSPLPHLALQYNSAGMLLECSVKLTDFVVYPEDITKVRCKKVTVIGEYKEPDHD